MTSNTKNTSSVVRISRLKKELKSYNKEYDRLVNIPFDILKQSELNILDNKEDKLLSACNTIESIIYYEKVYSKLKDKLNKSNGLNFK